MTLDEGLDFFSLGEGCPTHGEEHIRECTMCGAEFCTQCFRSSVICPDCAAEAAEGDDDPDFDDVTHIDDLENLIGDDQDIEAILEASEEMPPPDELADDTAAGERKADETHV